MKRVYLIIALALAACSTAKRPSLCDKPNAPPVCRLACEPFSQTPSTCPGGSYCTRDGHCAVDCTGDKECGGGGKCSPQGRCGEPDKTIGDWAVAILDFPATKWVLLILALVMPLASILTWMERRQSAMMQDRLGPNRANIGPIRLKGILHFVADALKMIFKEDFIPANVHKGLFALAPILAIAPVFIAFAIIPFGPTIYPHSLTPSIGASGSIAGVLGAFLVLRPHARILTLFPLVVYWAMAEIPAVLFLPVWFGMQFFSGFLSLQAARGTQEVAGVAWWAHVGGFLFGMVTAAIWRATRTRLDTIARR